jgi:hypothetical protein
VVGVRGDVHPRASSSCYRSHLVCAVSRRWWPPVWPSHSVCDSYSITDYQRCVSSVVVPSLPYSRKTGKQLLSPDSEPFQFSYYLVELVGGHARGRRGKTRGKAKSKSFLLVNDEKPRKLHTHYEPSAHNYLVSDPGGQYAKESIKLFLR